ncbi:MAG: glycosyltransferase [Enterocloster bolteae]
MKNHGLVSIIVPVYNADKWLGYCLNALMAQTYPWFEAVLVNDGSTDSSLDICNQYEQLDPRFHVVTVENGGVSRARNIGIAQAMGDWLCFVDSDDVVAPNMLEELVEAATRTGMELVIGNKLVVDFSAPKADHRLLTARWLGLGEHVLGRDDFARQRMRLIWHSALLEDLLGKLYSRELWNKLQLQLPPELSLGEDFVANMTYYDACNGVVFLDKIVYYYNRITGSGSLTDRYRPDLFENKMYLVRQLLMHLGPKEKQSQEEWACFCNYVASSGLRSMQETAVTSQLRDDNERVALLQKMMEDSLFRQGCEEADWVPKEFETVKKDVIARKPRKALEHLRSGNKSKEKRKNSQRSAVIVRLKKEVKRGLQGMLRPMQRVVRYCSRLQTAELNQGLTDLKRGVAELKWSAKEQKSGQEILESKITECRDILAQQQQAINRLKDEESKFYVWQQQTYIQQQVSELRQKKKAIMIATAEHQNIGDAAITLAEQDILRRYFPDYYQVEFSTYEVERKYDFLQAIVNAGDIIFIHGGGNIGNLYSVEEELHRRTITDFPNNQIVILPQSIFFSKDEHGQQQLELSQQVYNRHKNLTIFTRGARSYDFACKNFPCAYNALMLDSVFALRRDYGFKRTGILACLRTDEERTLPVSTKKILDTIKEIELNVEQRTNMAQEDISRVERASVVNAELQRYAHSKVVVTDRLHGMIFAVITGTPCVVLDNLTGKSLDVYETFLKDSNAVWYIGDNIDNLVPAIQQALTQETTIYPVFDKYSFDELKKVLE